MLERVAATHGHHGCTGHTDGRLPKPDDAITARREASSAAAHHGLNQMEARVARVPDPAKAARYPISPPEAVDGDTDSHRVSSVEVRSDGEAGSRLGIRKSRDGVAAFPQAGSGPTPMAAPPAQPTLLT